MAGVGQHPIPGGLLLRRFFTRLFGTFFRFLLLRFLLFVLFGSFPFWRLIRLIGESARHRQSQSEDQNNLKPHAPSRFDISSGV